MSQRLVAKDELLKRADERLKQMANFEKEMETLRKKAELTPTMRVIKNELVNVKVCRWIRKFIDYFLCSIPAIGS